MNLGNLVRVAASLAALVLAPALAAAQQPTFTYASEEAKKELAVASPVEWKAAAQGSLLLTAGNSRLTAVSAGLKASRKAGKNKLELEAGLAYGRSSIFLAVDSNADGAIQADEVDRPTSTTNKGWASKARYDRFLSLKDSIFGAALAAADEPAGKEFVGGGQVGYSRQLIATSIHTLVSEAGYDFSYEDPTAGDGAGIHSLRVFAGYTGKLSADTGVDGSVETLLNGNSYTAAGRDVDSLEDTRVTSKLALSTAVGKSVTFRFAFESKYDNAPSPRPPFALPYAAGFVPLADQLDSKVEASLIVNLL